MKSMDKPKLVYEKQHSAGGVPYRIADNKIEVVIFWNSFFPDQEKWFLPKGWLDKGETAEEAAIREVQEEAGVVATPEVKIETVNYKFKWEGKLIDKTVDYFLMKYVCGKPEDHGYEAKEARWFDIDQAIEKLDRPNEKKILKMAKVIITAKMSG